MALMAVSRNNDMASSQSWSDEWKARGLGASLPKDNDAQLTNLLFVQMGFGVDQHGNDTSNTGGSGGGATKAAVRAVRNAIEFNSIPGIVEAVPGGRSEMLISGMFILRESVNQVNIDGMLTLSCDAGAIKSN